MGTHDNQVCLRVFRRVDDFLSEDPLDEAALPWKPAMLDALETRLHRLPRASLDMRHIGGHVRIP